MIDISDCSLVESSGEYSRVEVSVAGDCTVESTVYSALYSPGQSGHSPVTSRLAV